MARRHGWQLPAHSFQVIAITVYFLLSIAFYAFFAPFLGKDIYEYIAVAAYSFLALSVFILYVRCTAIDPSDPGILIGFDEASAYKSQNKLQMSVGDGASLEAPKKMGLETTERPMEHNSSTCSVIAGVCCAFLVKEDCRKDQNATKQQTDNEEALFCTLCNAEVRKFSKHCRSCDKCVDGFDHHCRWLNNCVGRKNYITFLSLMSMSLVWLVVGCGVGIAVLARCFTAKETTKTQISERLGSCFSIVPFATVVGICTFVSLMASIPLGELFFFHMILIRKGITTYEYVVAMRSQSEPPGPSVNGDQQSLPSSPNSSAVTAISGGSSIGLQYRGAWCTPPRIFVDQQDEIIPHLEPGRLPSTVDPDTFNPLEKGKRLPKRQVRISAWKLAKMDSNAAMRAAAKARASSSVLRPINSRLQYDTDCSSSANVSSRSSAISADIGLHRDSRTGTLRSSSLKSPYPLSQASREDNDTCPHTPSSFSSPYYTNTLGGVTSPLEQQHSNTRHFNPIYQSSANRSPLSVQSNDGNDGINCNEVEPDLIINNVSMVSARPSVYWDQEVGRFVSAQNTAHSSSRVGGTELLYTGQSIFFGGPLLNDGAVRNSGTGGTSNQRQGAVDRRRGSYQLPVFIPTETQKDRSSRFP